MPDTQAPMSRRRFLRIGAAFAAAILLLIIGFHFHQAPRREAPVAGPALWKLSDADSTVWLFGTVHVMNPKVDWRSPAIDAAFKAADTFISEAPIEQLAPADMVPLIDKYGYDHQAPAFMDRLGPAARADTLKALAMAGLDEQIARKRFDHMRPWLVAVSLQGAHVIKSGASASAGVDRQLWRDASQAGKNLRYFETVEQQIRLFGDLSPEDDLKLYGLSIHQFVTDPDQMDRLVAAWLKGDVATVGAEVDKSSGTMAESQFRDRVLTNRNKDWARQIKALMAGHGTFFVAVGAGHLAGEGSLQDQLRALGYTVTRQ